MTAATAIRFTLRPATPDDCASLVRLISALVKYEKFTHLVRTTPETPAMMLFGPRPYCEAVLVEVDGRAMGFALLFHNFSTFLYKLGLCPEGLFVEPEYRGLGIGKALLIHLARLVQERDCSRFEWSMLDWNAPSTAPYKAMGADALPEWRTCRATGDALIRLAVTVMPVSLAISAWI